MRNPDHTTESLSSESAELQTLKGSPTRSRVLTPSALRDSEDKYRRVIENANEAIVVTQDGMLRFFNSTALEITGHTREELASKPFAELIHPDDREMVAGRHLGRLRGEPTQDVNAFRIIDPSGTIKWLEISAVLIEWEGRPATLNFLSDVTERVRAEEALRRRNRELALLNRVITAATSSLDVDQVLKTVCAELAQAFELPEASAVLLNEQRTEATVVAEFLAPGRSSGLNIRLALVGNPVLEHTLLHKTSLHSSNARQDDRLTSIHHFLDEYGIKALLIVPVMDRCSVVGAIVLVDVEPREFSDEEIALAETVTASVGQALEMAQLHQALHHHASRLEILHQIDLAILATRSPEAIAEVALRPIRELVPCHRASVVVFDFETERGRVLSTHAEGKTKIKSGVQLPLMAFDTNEKLSEGEIHFVEDTMKLRKPPKVVRELQAEGVRSYVGLPLKVQDQLIGALYLGARNPNAFSDGQLKVAQELANHLAIALQQAQLRGELQRHMENLEALVRERTAELQVALEQARSTDRLKSEFVSNVSHELRTPLANIKLYTALLDRGVPAKRTKYLDTLRREIGRLQDLIESLLDLSRLDLGRTDVLLQPTELNLLVSTLVTDREALVADRGLRLDAELADELPLAQADSQLLEQVLTNLLTNAINYTPAGGQVCLRTNTAEAEDRDWVTFSVADSGPGIPDEERPHLFERFFRGTAGRHSDAPGTGLGLAICKEIVELHGGRITVKSQVGRGTTFTVWLQPARSTTAIDEH